jgi:ERCC4-type nuclease
MITIDDRAGSGDLVSYLRPRAELGRLEFGDASLEGEGPDGLPILVGVEIKTCGDALKCLTDGRFAGHQLPGLVSSYNVVYLLVEGDWRRDMKSGLLQFKWLRKGKSQWYDASIGARRFMWSDFDRWFMTMEIKGGIRVRFVRDRLETAQFLKDLDKWWAVDGWDSHQSHRAFDESGGLTRPSELMDRAMLTRPGLVRLVAKELPGVGWGKSQAVEKAFPTVADMVMASEKTWAGIDGIGKTMAARLYASLRGIKSAK